MATPTMPASANGESITRSSPKVCHRPSVARKIPPFTPMSSPIRTTLASLSISSRRASRTASIIRITAMVSPLSKVRLDWLVCESLSRHSGGGRNPAIVSASRVPGHPPSRVRRICVQRQYNSVTGRRAAPTKIPEQARERPRQRLSHLRFRPRLAPTTLCPPPHPNPRWSTRSP